MYFTAKGATHYSGRENHFIGGEAEFYSIKCMHHSDIRSSSSFHQDDCLQFNGSPYTLKPRRSRRKSNPVRLHLSQSNPDHTLHEEKRDTREKDLSPELERDAAGSKLVFSKDMSNDDIRNVLHSRIRQRLPGYFDKKKKMKDSANRLLEPSTYVCTPVYSLFFWFFHREIRFQYACSQYKPSLRDKSTLVNSFIHGFP